MLALFPSKPLFLVLHVLHLPYFTVSCWYSRQSAVYTSIWYLAIACIMSYVISVCYESGKPL